MDAVLRAILEVVAPVFVLAAAGFVYAGRRTLPIGAITDLIIHLTGACLVFDALSRAAPFDLVAGRIPLSAACVVLGGLALAALAHRTVPALRRLPRGAVLLPAGFMNAGNLGLPLTQLAYGDRGLELGMLFFVTVSVLTYTVGIAIVSDRGGVKEMLRLPLVYAAVLGLVVNQTQVELPSAVAVPIRMLGQTVIPLMLLSLGARMRTLVGRGDDARPAWGSVLWLPALRMGGGLALGLLVNLALGNEGLVARIVVLVAGLPPAVMNFAMVEKYGEDPEAPAVVSAAIAVGTGVALLTLPLTLAVLG